MKRVLLATLLVTAATCAGGHFVSDAQADTIGTLLPSGYSDVGTPNSVDYTFTATGADITAYFLGSSAADTDLLEISIGGAAFTPVSGTLANVSPTQTGSSYDFGTIAAGTILTFAIYNENTGDTLTSDPTLNADGDQHVWSTDYAYGTVSGTTCPGSNCVPSGTLLAFEDLLAGQNSDFDYNDYEVVVAGLDPTPLPAALPLFATGLGVMGLFGRRRKRTAAAVVA